MLLVFVVVPLPSKKSGSSEGPKRTQHPNHSLIELTCSETYISYMGVSLNGGIPKWMVKIMEKPIKIGDLGVPSF